MLPSTTGNIGGTDEVHTSCPRGKGLTPRRDMTDSHRGQDFLIVRTGIPDWFRTNGGTLRRGRFIGQQFPYPVEKGGPSGWSWFHPGSPGGWTSARAKKGEVANERGTSHVSHPSRHPSLHDVIQPAARWKRSHFHPFRPEWTSCRSDRQSDHPPPPRPS